MSYVAQLNREARHSPQVPAVTLCTGRQEPYVEVLMQAIDAYLPAIYENGGGLYFSQKYRRYRPGKGAVDCVSPYEDGDGVVDVLCRWSGQYNGR